MNIGAVWPRLLAGALVVTTSGCTPVPVPTAAYYPPQPAPPPIPEIRWKSVVIVCALDNPDLSTAVRTEMREVLPRAANVWNSVANAQITVVFAADAEQCMPALSQVVLDSPISSIVFAEQMSDAMGFAAADALGNTLSSGARLHFATQYPWNDAICGRAGVAGPSACRFGDAVHEFGHLLGFTHDHLSASAPSCIDLQISNEHRDAAMTYYDPLSVMNYCNPERWKGQLSPADICSIQVAYPLADGPPRTDAECFELARKAAAAASGTG